MNHYTKEFLEPIIEKCFSWAQVLRELKLKQNGASQAYLKKVSIKLDISFGHFKGQAWLKGKRYEKVNIEEYLNNKKRIGTNNLKKRLFGSKLKEELCEECGLSEWLGKKIPLELHHINSNNEDNRIDNLQILCPNCHSLETIEHRFKNRKPIEKEIDKRTLRKERLNQRKVKNRPSKEILIKEVEDENYCAVGRKYGVSDNCIRKWILAGMLE